MGYNNDKEKIHHFCDFLEHSNLDLMKTILPWQNYSISLKLQYQARPKKIGGVKEME